MNESTQLAFNLSDLPLDLIDPIISHIDSRRDLISLAAASRIYSTLIIPKHTEYRTIRLSVPRPDIWAHLVQRPDLAGHVRTVEIIGSRTWLPDMFPSTMVDSVDHERGSSDIHDALRHMHSLRRFVWRGPVDETRDHWSIFQVLSESRSLVDLSVLIVDSEALQTNMDSEDFPLWRIANLTRLRLADGIWGGWQRDSLLTSMLLRSPNLQTLEITLSLDSPCFLSCRFHQLRKLKLVGVYHGGPHQEEHIRQFLSEHPTIEDLHWHPKFTSAPLTCGTLPILKQLSTSVAFIPTVLSARNSTLESIGQLSLNARTLRLLEQMDGSKLRELYLWRYDFLTSIHRLAELLPALEVLGIPSLGIPNINDMAHDYTIDDYILALARFRSLKRVEESAIWTVALGSKKAADVARMLGRLCPKLVSLGHYDHDRHLPVDIVLVRTGDSVTWEQILRYDGDDD